MKGILYTRYVSRKRNRKKLLKYCSPVVLIKLEFGFLKSTFKMIGRDLSNTLFHCEKVFESTKH